MGFEGVGNCLKYLKRGWNRKEGRGNKDLKKMGNLGQGVGALKRGTGTPLRTMVSIQLETSPSVVTSVHRFISIKPIGMIIFAFIT